MGWLTNAIVVAGTFVGYKYLQHDSGALKNNDCAKIQCSAVTSKRGDNGFPALSDDQKMIVTDTLRDLTLKAGKLLDSGTQKYGTIPVILRDGNGYEKSFLILVDDSPTLIGRLSSVGLGVTSAAGSIIVQGGLNLLDPDVLMGVATMQSNYQRRTQRNDPSIGLQDNFNERRQLDAVMKSMDK